MKEIELTQNQTAWVDDEDFHQLNQHKWYAQWSPCTRSYYAVREIRDKKKRFSEHMHRRIMGVVQGDKLEVDHANHNTLDNRKKNLSVVSHRQNQANRKDQSRHGVGVRRRLSGRFQACVTICSRQISLGMFDTVDAAVQARVEFTKGIE